MHLTVDDDKQNELTYLCNILRNIWWLIMLLLAVVLLPTFVNFATKWRNIIRVASDIDSTGDHAGGMTTVLPGCPVWRRSMTPLVVRVRRSLVAIKFIRRISGQVLRQRWMRMG